MSFKPKKLSMTSREAAALYLSGGATTDVYKANLMADGQLLDPEALERAYWRRLFGFDFEVEMRPDKAIARDKDLGFETTCSWFEADDEGNAKRLAKACVRLKKLHDTRVMMGAHKPEDKKK